MYSHPNLPMAVRAICKSNNLTQSQLAAHARISTATLRKILDGGKVRLTAIVGIASALDMTATQFMEFLDKMDLEKISADL